MKVVYKIAEMVCHVIPFDPVRIAILMNVIIWFAIGFVPFLTVGYFISDKMVLFRNMGFAIGSLIAIFIGYCWGCVVLMKDEK